jgi:hypothetical protein
VSYRSADQRLTANRQKELLDPHSC